MHRVRVTWLAAACVALGTASAAAQQFAPAAQPAPLTATGQITLNGHSAAYLVRHLPVNSFPQLPAAVQAELNRRGCLIPQTYEAHRPENVVNASLERSGSSDWAVLCSAEGAVSLLVFFGDRPAEPFVLASAPETERVQAHDASGVLGFAWGIDPASPEQVHQAQAGLQPRPPRLDHDALADTIIDHATVYHFYAKNAWTRVDMPY